MQDQEPFTETPLPSLDLLGMAVVDAIHQSCPREGYEQKNKNDEMTELIWVKMDDGDFDYYYCSQN